MIGYVTLGTNDLKRTVKMRLISTALAVTSTVGVAGGETIGIDVLRSVCLAHGASASSIAADVTARGWRQIDEQERLQRDADNMGGGFSMHWTSSQAWAPPDDASLTLVLGEGPVDSGSAQFCMVTDDRSFADQVRDVRRWLGFGRFATWGPGGDIFAYIREDDGTISDGAGVSEAERQSAARAGHFGFVQVVGDRDSSAINFSLIHPAPEAHEE